jgi:hypothetical protein
LKIKGRVELAAGCAYEKIDRVLMLEKKCNHQAASMTLYSLSSVVFGSTITPIPLGASSSQQFGKEDVCLLPKGRLLLLECPALPPTNNQAHSPRPSKFLPRISAGASAE